MTPRASEPAATAVVRCPAEDCAARFPVRPRQLGRSLHCPVCRARLTARPAEVGPRLAGIARRAAGAPGLAIPRLPLVALLDDVRSLWNVGSIFRTADACGVRELVLCGITGQPPRPEIAKTALGAERSVAWSYGPDAERALARLVRGGYEPVAVETTREAVDPDALEWPDRICLVVGNEVTGISPGVLAACSRHVRIPMRGVKESLNVAVAFGIAAYQAARALAVAPGGARAAAR